MKLRLFGKIAAISTLCFTNIIFPLPSHASTFEQQEVNQEEFIAIARPYGDNKYDLLVLRQVPGEQQCWSETGSNPVLVNPLLLNFNFTGSCHRSTDSNGYSIRIDGQDYGLDYLLRLVKRDGELVLIGNPRKNPSQPEIVIGRSNGIASGFIKLNLDSGWRFTKRTYKGKELGHIYLTGDSSAMGEQVSSVATISEQPNQDNRPTREMTFTSESKSAIVVSSSSPSVSASPNAIVVSSSSPSVSASPKSFSSVSSASSSTLPPPPQPRSFASTPEPLPDFSDLPPLAPPVRENSRQIVPPPKTPTNSGRSGLSNVVDSLSNPTPTVQPSNNRGYRVIVAANDNNQKGRVRSLYPEAFPTSHNGRSVWQVGRFSSRNNAEQVHRTLENAGLKPIIIP